MESNANGAITLPCVNVSGQAGHTIIFSWIFTTVPFSTRVRVRVVKTAQVL